MSVCSSQQLTLQIELFTQSWSQYLLRRFNIYHSTSIRAWPRRWWCCEDPIEDLFQWGWVGGCVLCDNADASWTGTQPVLPTEDGICKVFSDGSTWLSANIFSRCASPFWENESHLNFNLEVSMLKLCILMHAMTRGFLHPSVSSEDRRLGVRTCVSVGWVAAWIFDLCEAWQHASKDA